MRHRRFLGFLLVVPLALGAGYFFGRSHAGANPADTDPARSATHDALTQAKPSTQAGAATAHKPVRMHLKSHYSVNPTPLPSADTPLAQTYAQLKALADAGNAQAASRLYRDVQRCSQAHDIERELPELELITWNQHSDKPTTDELKGEQRMLDNVQKLLDFAKDSRALCVGVTDDELANRIPVTLQAAQLGDEQATNCYLGTNFANMPGLLDHPEWLTDFRQNALELADSNLKNGDWESVELLQSAYQGNISFTLLGQLTGSDPVQSYRYLQLTRLGTDDNSAKWLDKQLATAVKQLTAAQIADANAWAAQTYSQYFNSAVPAANFDKPGGCLDIGVHR